MGLVVVNGLLVWVREAEQESDPERRRRLADTVLQAVDGLRTGGTVRLAEREYIHFDWIEGRALICGGLDDTAVSKLERVRAHFESEGRFVQAAVVGNDLLFAHAAAATSPPPTRRRGRCSPPTASMTCRPPR